MLVKSGLGWLLPGNGLDDLLGSQVDRRQYFGRLSGRRAGVTIRCINFGFLYLAESMSLVALVAMDVGHPLGNLILFMLHYLGRTCGA
jgi:hypothetical protein